MYTIEENNDVTILNFYNMSIKDYEKFKKIVQESDLDPYEILIDFPERENDIFNDIPIDVFTYSYKVKFYNDYKEKVNKVLEKNGIIKSE